MAQTGDMLRTLHDRPIGPSDYRYEHRRIADALERIADALEAQVADQHDQAAFSRLLLHGLTPDQASGVEFEDYRETPEGWEVLIPGEGWREATMAEEQEIADMNQKRKRR